MKGLTRTLAIGLAATAVGAAPAHAQGEPAGPPSPCPAAFTPVPSILDPGADKNDDGILCVKADTGESGVVVVRDNPQPVVGQ